MPAEGLATNRWYLEMDGITEGYFKEVSGGDIEIEVVEVRHTSTKGNVVNQKIPGNIKYSNIVMRRGMTDDRKLWDWIKKCVDGQVQTSRKNGTLTQYDPSQKPIRKISFTNAWPCKYKVPNVDSTKNEVSIEELEICVEKVEVQQ